jgi:hypothetical protein
MKEQAHASWCGPRVAITRVACGRCLLEKWLRHRVIDAIRYITGTPRQRSFFQHLKDLDLGRRDDMGSENVVAGGPPGVGVHFLARSAPLHHLQLFPGPELLQGVGVMLCADADPGPHEPVVRGDVPW